MREQVNFGKMLHGGDYNPEQWLDMPEILEKDIEYFKKAKINQSIDQSLNKKVNWHMQFHSIWNDWLMGPVV